jgi:hypothetical protein
MICGMRAKGFSGALNRWVVGSGFALALASGLAQQPATPPQSNVLPMPQDRAAKSYEIYSKLLPGNEIEWGNVPRSFWLVEGTTTALPLDSPCATAGMMNPHQAVQTPQPRRADFAEVLADYDARCHDRYQLDASHFRLKLPVHTLDEEAQKRYMNHVSGYIPPKNNIMQAPPTPGEFKGAAGMHSFTAVYFNHAHTLAMTQIGMYCGGLCGNWRWVVLERSNDSWKVLPWVTISTIS